MLDEDRPIEAHGLKNPLHDNGPFKVRVVATDLETCHRETWLVLVDVSGVEIECRVDPETGEGYGCSNAVRYRFINTAPRVKGWIAVEGNADTWRLVADKRIFRSLDLARRDGPHGRHIVFVEVDGSGEDCS